MVKYLLAKVGGALVIALASAIGYTLDATQLANIGYKWWPLIGFGFFALILLWIIADLYRANNRLLDVHPSISTEIASEADVFYLKVLNKGAEAMFRAQVSLSSDDPDVWCLPHYNGCWKYNNKDETRILKGQTDSLKIAELHSSRMPGPISQHLEIWFFDPKANYAHGVSTSSHWLGATISSPDGSTKPLTKHKYKLCITISATPSLKEDIYEGHLLLDIDGLRFDTTSQSVSHKKGSQI